MIGVIAAAPPCLRRPICFWRTAGLAVTIVTMTGWTGPSHGGAIERISAGSLSLEERADLRCPQRDAPGPFAEPLAVIPSPEMVVMATYSDGQDVVRLAGDEAPIYPDLGAGDDFAFIYSADFGWNVVAGSGADTVVVCSMDDLGLSIQLATWAGESDPDVVVVESAVFTSVPESMLRSLVIEQYDPAYDRLVIHAPAALLEARQSSMQLRGIRIGDVTIRLSTATGAEQLNLGGKNVNSVTFIPSETSASRVMPDSVEPPAQN